MPTDVNKYTPLKQIVSFVLDQHDLNYQRYFDKCWLLAFRAMVDIGFDMSFEPKTLRIPLNGNQTATLPSDYISWTKIGLQDANGQISTLKINNALTTYADNSPDRIQKIEQIQVNTSIGLLAQAPVYLNYYYNAGYYNLYGVGGGLIQYGECRVDEKNNVIIFPPNFIHDSVLLEYLSSPEKDGDYVIQTCLQEAVMAFIEWKLKLAPEVSYYHRKIEGRRKMDKKKVTLQDINQVLRESDSMKLRS